MSRHDLGEASVITRGDLSLTDSVYYEPLPRPATDLTSVHERLKYHRRARYLNTRCGNSKFLYASRLEKPLTRSSFQMPLLRPFPIYFCFAVALPSLQDEQLVRVKNGSWNFLGVGKCGSDVLSRVYDKTSKLFPYCQERRRRWISRGFSRSRLRFQEIFSRDRFPHLNAVA
jgi:hypothetical protein